MFVGLHEKALQRSPFSQFWGWTHPTLALIGLLPFGASPWLAVGHFLAMPSLGLPLSISFSLYCLICLFLCSDFLLHRGLTRFY